MTARDVDHAAITRAVDEAAHHRGAWRAMRVTLECGHLVLMPQHATVMGIGAQTGCRVCDGCPARVVVNVEETGVLHETFHKRGDS